MLFVDSNNIATHERILDAIRKCLHDSEYACDACVIVAWNETEKYTFASRRTTDE